MTKLERIQFQVALAVYSSLIQLIYRCFNISMQKDSETQICKGGEGVREREREKVREREPEIMKYGSIYIPGSRCLWSQLYF